MNESDNVVKFPNFNIFDIPEALRKVANDIEKTPDIAENLMLCDRREDGVVWYKAFGRDLNRAQAIGILEYAKHDVMGVPNGRD